MKKTNNPNQMTLFDLTELARNEPESEKRTRWYYLASPRRVNMIVGSREGLAIAPHNLMHVCPRLYGSKRLARIDKQKMIGDWDIILYPYSPF